MTADRPWRPERVRVGTVGRAHGLDGSFHVDDPCGWWAFAVGTAVLVEGVERVVRRRAGTADRPLVGVDAVTDRDGAEALRGGSLEIAAVDIPDDPEAYYRFDLVGCEVVHRGRAVARVAAVEDGVAHDLLLLDDPASTRIPFVEALVPEVDIDARRVVIADDLALGVDDA